MAKKIAYVVFLLLILSYCRITQCEGPYKVVLEFLEFSTKTVQAGVPFEIIYKFRNAGAEPINPFAQMTLYGNVVDEKGNPVLRILDKQLNIYNLWPGEAGGAQRIYIGVLPKGKFTIKLHVNAYSKVKNKNLSNELFEKKIDVN